MRELKAKSRRIDPVKLQRMLEGKDPSQKVPLPHLVYYIQQRSVAAKQRETLSQQKAFESGVRRLWKEFRRFIRSVVKIAKGVELLGEFREAIERELHALEGAYSGPGRIIHGVETGGETNNRRIKGSKQETWIAERPSRNWRDDLPRQPFWTPAAVSFVEYLEPKLGSRHRACIATGRLFSLAFGYPDDDTYKRIQDRVRHHLAQPRTTAQH
jgi:hypothetical protein